MSEDTSSSLSPALVALLASTSSSRKELPLDPSRQIATSTSNTTRSGSGGGGPIPMSMPAILQQPKNKHLLNVLGQGKKKDTSSSSRGGGGKGKDGSIPGGKRRRRRWENAQLAGNPHLHRPSRSDFAPGPNLKHLSTTFAPPPTNFSRSTYSSPDTGNSSTDSSESLGQFSMSLKGLRKNLRSSVVGSRVLRRGEGGRTEEVLDIMERELKSWISFEGRIEPGFFHDGTISMAKVLDDTPLEDYVPTPTPTLPDEPTSSSSKPVTAPPPTLIEITRLPHTLVWLTPSPQYRFLLHSLARYYRLQSFSRALNPLDPEVRVTHILRPQIARPTLRPHGGGSSLLETPPGTDWSSASGTTTEMSSFEVTSASSEGETSEGELVTTDDDEEWDRSSTTYGSVGGRNVGELEVLSSGESEYGADRDAGYSTNEDEGIESLASSLADLSTVTPSTPRPGSTLPFVPFVPSNSTTPTTTLLSSLPSSTPRPSRARGRRSIPTGGRDSIESSPSRSPTRVVDAVLGGGGAMSAAEWKMPERGFADWVFD